MCDYFAAIKSGLSSSPSPLEFARDERAGLRGFVSTTFGLTLAPRIKCPSVIFDSRGFSPHQVRGSANCFVSIGLCPLFGSHQIGFFRFKFPRSFGTLGCGLNNDGFDGCSVEHGF
jgi:hypothetical protein